MYLHSIPLVSCIAPPIRCVKIRHVCLTLSATNHRLSADQLFGAILWFRFDEDQEANKLALHWTSRFTVI